MTTQTIPQPPAATAPVVPPVTPPVTPPVVPGAAAAPSNEPPATPPVVPPAVPTAPAADPFANSNWPPSAKDKVRDLARKSREKSDAIAQKDAYIQQLEAKVGQMKHPSREQFPDGDAGDHAFVNALTAHHSNASALNIEKVRATGELEPLKQDIQATQQQLQTERINLARQEYPDLDTVVQNSRLPVSQHLGYALQMADNGPQMMYILNKLHPQETQRLNTMGWTEILQDFPVIEARYRASQNKPAPAVPPPATPPAPPIEPVGGDGGPPSSGNGYKEWETERNKNDRLRF